MTEVEGGLDEPTELEPEQGSLDLAAPEDDHARADWERPRPRCSARPAGWPTTTPTTPCGRSSARTTLDGIAVTPLGTPDLLDDLATTGRPQRSGDWDVRAHLDIADPKLANEAALVDLDERGHLAVARGRSRTPTSRPLLDGVLLDLAPVVLDVPADPVAAAEGFVTHAGDTDLAEGTNLGADPLGARVRGLSTSSTDARPTWWSRSPGWRARSATLALVVDATAVHDLGASDAQELGYSMAAGATYLRILTDAGLGVDDAAELVEFRYAATDEQFPTIAKLRAARRLWARVLELERGRDPREQRQHAVTSRPMMSKYDPWVNMLRTTVAAFAAGVGGADAVTVLPFDAALGVPDAFGRRIARNTSSLLIDESHVAQVADPAGGSYAVEKLTDDLAAAGVGGARPDRGGRRRRGRPRGRLAHGPDRRGRREREAEIARRKRPITGVTEFPNLAETLPERAPYPHGAGVRRYGAGFEALRDEPADAPVFLATMGTVAAHTARATFATNLFAAGGIAVERRRRDRRRRAACWRRTTASRSSAWPAPTPAYAEWGADRSPRSARGRRAVGDRRRQARSGDSSVDDTCAMGVDALDFLTRTREKLA